MRGYIAVFILSRAYATMSVVLGLPGATMDLHGYLTDLSKSHGRRDIVAALPRNVHGCSPPDLGSWHMAMLMFLSGETGGLELDLHCPHSTSERQLISAASIEHEVAHPRSDRPKAQVRSLMQRPY